MSSNLIFSILNRMPLSSQRQTDQHWPTFEGILQGLHSQGIYIHPEQLAEFLLAHGLPVHLRYVPAHLRARAMKVNENYRGDMVCLVEELEPPCWDFSWMHNTRMPYTQIDLSDRDCPIEELEQPFWDYSWLK